MSRLRRVALLPLALLCVFTIGAGTAAARLLPARLALFPLPSAATCGLAAPGPVVRAASGAVQGATGRVPGSEPPRPEYGNKRFVGRGADLGRQALHDVSEPPGSRQGHQPGDHWTSVGIPFEVGPTEPVELQLAIKATFGCGFSP